MYKSTACLVLLVQLAAVQSFSLTATSKIPTRIHPSLSNTKLNLHGHNQDNHADVVSTRRSLLEKSCSILPLLATGVLANPSISQAARSGAEDSSDKYAPKFVQTYEDFSQTDEGWQYKDVKVGSGDVQLENGDRAVFDWSGYTIGYFGRPFEAKGGPQGGAFDKDVDYSRTVIGSGTVVPGIEKALKCMKPGGVRQVIVPYGDLSYPADDLEHTRVGPKPTTFSGQRALNFVLENARVDRTLLFNVKLIRIDKSNGKGGFNRG